MSTISMITLALVVIVVTAPVFAQGFGKSQFSVAFKDYQSAPCKTRLVKMPEVEAYLATFSQLPATSGLRSGVRFVNQPLKLINAFGNLVNKKTNVKTRFNIPDSCNTVRCAVTTIWGQELGLKMLYLRLKHRFVGSELFYSRTHRLTITEIDSIIMALGDLPEDMPFNENKIQKIVSSSYQREGAAADASPVYGIRLYSAWRGEGYHYSPEMLRFSQLSTLVHELGHLRGFFLNTHMSAEWEGIRKSCSVSTYGNTNTMEDFAETFRAYRYNARALLDNCPGKYSFMQDRVFNGVEYLDEVTCRLN